MAVYQKFKRHYADLKKNLGEDKALELFPEYVAYPENMSLQERANLARRLMERIDAELDHDMIVRIRQAHPCAAPKNEGKEMAEAWKKHGNMDEFLTEVGCIKQNDGTYIRKFGLKKCVCPMFRQLSEYEPVSLT